MYFSQRDAGLCIYHLFVWSNLNFLLISQWITLPTHSSLVLYSFYANLLHLFITRLMVSSLSLLSLHSLFCCGLSIIALILLVLMALFCAAFRRDSVSLLKFPFLSHVQVFSCEMLFISRLKHPKCCFSSHFCVLVIVILLYRSKSSTWSFGIQTKMGSGKMCSVEWVIICKRKTNSLDHVRSKSNLGTLLEVDQRRT